MMAEESANPDLASLVRRQVEAANRRDFDAVESLYAPDCRLRGAKIGEFEGQAAARGAVEDMVAPYEDFRADIEEVLDLGRGVTFAVIVARGRVGGSSAEVQFRFATVATSKRDLIERQFNFIDVDEARAAAEHLAMSEEPPAPDAAEVVWRYRDAMVRRDFDAVEQCFEPNVCVVTAASGTLEGRAALRTLVEDILRPYETWGVEDGAEIRSVGNGVVLATFVLSGRMGGSVHELRSPFSSVSVVANGLIEWHGHYADPDEARAVAERLAQERSA